MIFPSQFVPLPCDDPAIVAELAVPVKPADSDQVYGAIKIELAFEPKELHEDKELQAMMTKHFIRRHWDVIRCDTYPDHRAYDPFWIQGLLYN